MIAFTLVFPCLRPKPSPFGLFCVSPCPLAPPLPFAWVRARARGVEPLPIPCLDFVCTDRADAPLYAGWVSQPCTAHHTPPDCLADGLALVKRESAGLAESSHRTTDINELPRCWLKHKGVKVSRLCLLDTEHPALLISKHPLFGDLLAFGVADKPSIHGFTKCYAVRVAGVCLPVFGEPTQGGFGHLANGRPPPFANWANWVQGFGLRFLVNFGELVSHTIKPMPSVFGVSG